MTTTITTAANYDIGGTSADATRFEENSTLLTAGNVDVGLDHWADAAVAQAAADTLRITTDVNPGAGAIRVTVYALSFVEPTS